ncbi:uncharacterized protein EDB93DRAFT_1110972 [Suillus bovinus]|uniref:uncharacterized protein n=1 Tax=Suillus bovinus TaxID=48563 RepID=UPI001B8838A4|nr:uncharacterized protein EDB93DRAFT_1110972 [Suillus bovinus]KAG2122147.1 hypothetical protein EDB93DRAFT_1110972 [Suillus bovinus]
MSLPIAQPLMVPRLNFGMDLDITAAPSAAPPTPWFNFGMNLCIPAAIPPSSPALPTSKPFNLGFALPLPTQPAPKLFNLGFNLLVQSMGMPALTPPPPTTKPFNLGFNVPMAVTLLPISSGLVPALTPPPPTTKPFNLGFNFPMAVTLLPTSSRLVPAQEDTRHVGYDINNGYNLDVSLPPPLGSGNQSSFAYHDFRHMLPHDAAPGPSMSFVLSHTGRHLDRPTLKSLLGDAKCAAIDVLNRLGGKEFDHLAQMMVGGALGPGDDVQDPKPDEVLESNRVHERVLSAVESLLDEVDQAEAQSGEEM